ncbi:MAG: MarR family winged helix-turn-helix transcriptional regulator [Planctomycetota bacterium]
MGQKRCSSVASVVDTIAANCLAVRVRILSRDMTRLYDDALRPIGLRVTQLNVLVAVAKMQEAMPTEIGRHLHLDKSTLSRTLARMVEKGWLQEVEGDDARRRPVKLSRAGRNLIRDAFPLWQEAQREGKRIMVSRKLMHD